MEAVSQFSAEIVLTSVLANVGIRILVLVERGKRKLLV